jgi:hypothetical protein
MDTLRDEIRAFIAACESLLAFDLRPAMLNEREHQMIQFYLSAIGEKFPALLS